MSTGQAMKRQADEAQTRVRDTRLLSRLLPALHRLRTARPARRGAAQGLRLSGPPDAARRRDGVLWRRHQRSPAGLRRHHQGHEGIAAQWLNARSNPPFQRAKSGQVREALDRLEGLVVDGLKHGFFDYSIACEIGNGGKRQLVIRAGKSHKFTIPEDEVPR